MAVSVYDWMIVKKGPLDAPLGGSIPGREDFLVRILRVLDIETCKTPVALISGHPYFVIFGYGELNAYKLSNT